MKLNIDPFNIIITGVGGQGNVLASQILGHMLVQKGYVVTVGETYGASQRGGSVMSHLRISKQDTCSPLVPIGQCHLVIALEPSEGLRVLADYGNPDVDVLVNTRPIFPVDVIAGDASYPEVETLLQEIQNLSRNCWELNAVEIALELGNSIFANIVILGALTALNILPINPEDFHKTITEVMPPKRLAANITAFEKGTQALHSSAQ